MIRNLRSTFLYGILLKRVCISLETAIQMKELIDFVVLREIQIAGLCKNISRVFCLVQLAKGCQNCMTNNTKSNQKSM